MSCLVGLIGCIVDGVFLFHGEEETVSLLTLKANQATSQVEIYQPETKYDTKAQKSKSPHGTQVSP